MALDGIDQDSLDNAAKSYLDDLDNPETDLLQTRKDIQKDIKITEREIREATLNFEDLPNDQIVIKEEQDRISKLERERKGYVKVLELYDKKIASFGSEETLRKVYEKKSEEEKALEEEFKKTSFINLDIDDLLFGYWLKDVPYIIEEKEGRLVRRKYLIAPEDEVYQKAYLKGKDKCDRLLSINSIPKTIYRTLESTNRPLWMNGRRFYNFMFDAKHTRVEAIPQSPRMETFILKDDRYYDIFYLICGKLKGMNLSQVMKRLQECTPIGSRIASSLVKVAATRIFNVPEQAIVEIIVNSIDSYAVMRGLPKVGRFGMGFFSILYFLVGHPEREIEINSIVKENPEDKSGLTGSVIGTSRVLSRLKIREIDGNLRFNINILRVQNTTTGTIFKLHDPSSKLDTSLFNNYIDYLRLPNSVYIRSSNDRNITEIENTIGLTGMSLQVFHQEEKQLGVGVVDRADIVYKNKPNNLIVEDYATGIRSEVIFSSLLVPSISTKGMKVLDSPVEYKNYSGFYENRIPRFNFFSIAVNRVKLFNLPIKTDLYLGYDIVLSLPPSVVLPVTRDDIIFDSVTEREVEASLDILIDKAIELKNISMLSEALEEYKTYTSNSYNKSFVDGFLGKMYDIIVAKGHILVKPEHVDVLSHFIKKYIISDKVNYEQLEKTLDKLYIKYDENIFLAKRVVKMSQEIKAKTTSADTYKYLFVDYDTWNIKGWEDNLLLTFLEEKLDRADIKIDDRELKQTELTINAFAVRFLPGKEKLDKIRLLYKRVLSIYYKVQIPSDFTTALQKVIYLILLLAPGMIPSYVDMTIALCNKIKPNEKYTGGKKKLFIDTNCEGIIKEYKDVRGYPEAFLKIFREFVIESMKAIMYLNERSDTVTVFPFVNVLDLFPFDNTFVLFKQGLTVYELMFLVKCHGQISSASLSIAINAGFIANQARVAKIVYNKYLKKIESPILLFYNWLKPISLNYAENEMITYINSSMSGVKNVINRLTIQPNFVSQFTNKQLISYVFKEEKLDFLKDIPKIAKEKPEEGLQIIEIAVDGGTTKSFLEATLTELIQNSMDAIRISGAEDKSISITTGTLISDNKSCFCSIEDYVGMTLNNVQAISIPFYSSKTASEIATGEMGTGFFNVYRETSMVIIETIKDGQMITIRDQPVRKNGKIQDIEKNITIKPNRGFNGTTVTFVVPKKTEEEVLTFLSIASYVVTNIFAYMDFSDILLNEKSVKREKRLVYKLDELECYATDKGVKSYIFTKGVPFAPLTEYLDSSIKELNLHQDMFDFLDTNCIINIRHGFYTPVQSRTKLNIPPENLEKLSRFIKGSVFYLLIEYLYMACMHQQRIWHIDEEINNLLRETETIFSKIEKLRTEMKMHPPMSKVRQEIESEIDIIKEKDNIQAEKENLLLAKKNALKTVESVYPAINMMPLLNLFTVIGSSQVLPKWIKPDQKMDLKLTDILFYTPTPFAVPNIGSELYRGNTRMIDHLFCLYREYSEGHSKEFKDWEPQFDKYVKTVLDKIKDEEVWVLGQKFFKIIHTWIKTKKDVHEDKRDEDEKDLGEKAILKAKIKKVFQVFVNTFLDLARKNGIKGYPFEIPVDVKKASPDSSGYFDGTSIVINITYLVKEDVDHFLRNIPKYINDIGALRNDPFYQSYLGVSYPSSTLVHELEHARRNNRHDLGGAHGDTEESFMGKEKKRYTFNQMANEVLLYLTEKGLVPEFLGKVRNPNDW